MNKTTQKRWHRFDPSDVIADDWSKEEAIAVFDFLVGLVAAISERYPGPILGPFATERPTQTHTNSPPTTPGDDEAS